jgi:PAS domain S-box-containing protein
MEQDTTISLVNTEFEELTGYSKAEVEGKKRWTEFIMENDLDKLQVDPGTQRIGSSGVGGDYELKIVDRQGNVKDMHVTVSAVPGTNKSVVSAMDITEIRRAEEITKRDKEMLERLVRKGSKELIEAHRELAEAKRLSGIGTLAATVAHELRNPLGVIQTAVYNIRRKRREPTLDTHLTNIEKKISEGDQIIRNLLRYSRIKPPQYEKTNLTEILSDSIVSAATRFSNQSVEVNTAIDSIEDDVIYMDVIQIKEIFDNILNNAYQAVVDKEGRIEITGKIGPDRAVSITFSDNGIGINQEDLEQVFEPFFTKKTKGTGLGLTICRELVKLHGGSVEIHSKPGSGTTVTVTLPARRTEK